MTQSSKSHAMWSTLRINDDDDDDDRDVTFRKKTENRNQILSTYQGNGRNRNQISNRFFILPNLPYVEISFQH